MAEGTRNFGDLFRGKRLKGRGRPRKDSADELTYAQPGVTRQQAWDWRKLAEIPQDAFFAYLDKCKAEGKKSSIRGVLFHFGKRKNVATDDIFTDTPTGELANSLLQGFERIVPLMTPRQRRWVIRAMNYRMREICYRQGMEE
jgi:hypothetical protein